MQVGKAGVAVKERPEEHFPQEAVRASQKQLILMENFGDVCQMELSRLAPQVSGPRPSARLSKRT